jgi:hypothetical protein
LRATGPLQAPHVPLTNAATSHYKNLSAHQLETIRGFRWAIFFLMPIFFQRAFLTQLSNVRKQINWSA